MYILDSCVCIDLMRGKLPHTMQLMMQSSPALYKVPYIVEAELMCGVEKSSDKQRVRMLTENFLAPFERVAFDSNCARTYAKTRAYLEQRGMKIGPNDLIIAATALANNATVITQNLTEFKRVPGLSVENWEEIEI